MLLSLSNLPAAEQSCRVILCHLPAASVCSLQPDWGDDTPPAAPPPSPGPPPCTGSARTPGCQGQQALWFIHHLFVKKKAMLNRMGALSLPPPHLLVVSSHQKSFHKKACQFNSDFHPPTLQMVGIACIDVWGQSSLLLLSNQKMSPFIMSPSAVSCLVQSASRGSCIQSSEIFLHHIKNCGSFVDQYQTVKNMSICNSIM